MNRTKKILTTVFFGVLIQLLTACQHEPKKTIEPSDKNTMSTSSNPVVYFEIPVNDMERAINFYKAVFHFDFAKEIIDNNEMALFPFTAGNSGITGALAKGEIYKPTKDGVDPKTDNGIGFVAEFQDSEGNRIAIHQDKN